MAKAGPDFSDLGVTDPNTGKKVFLSAGEISTVMGATGGVAPTKFQAGVEGVMTGINNGQKIAQNYGNFQAQQANIASTKANTDYQNIENDIARQTQQATVLAKNNQTQQQAIQAQMQTDKLNNDNSVLQALRSGDATQISDALANPKFTLSNLENDEYVQATIGRIKADNGFTPQQLQTVEKYNKTRDIYKAGPVQDQYQAAGLQATGTMPVQQLKTASGLSSEELLRTMQIQQVPAKWSPTGVAPAIVAPDGSYILLDDTVDKKEREAITGFFGARDKLQNAAGFKPAFTATTGPAAPLKDFGSVAAASAEVAPVASGAAALPPPEGAAAPAPTGQPGAPGAPAAPVSAHPKSISATGALIATDAPQLKGYNLKTTHDGTPIQADLSERAFQIFNERGRTLTRKESYAAAAKEALAAAKVSPKAAKIAADNASFAKKKIEMAQEIREVADDAKKAGYPLGPTLPFKGLGRVYQEGAAGLNEAVSGEKNPISDIQTRINSLESRYSILVMQSSGMGVKAFDSDTEGKKLARQGPTYSATGEEFYRIANRLEREAKLPDDENALVRFLDVQGVPENEAKELVTEYFKTNKPLIFDPVTNDFIPNLNREDPIDWIYKKREIDIDKEVLDTFAKPTSRPKDPPQQSAPLAPGSGTARPFDQATKQTASAFPAAVQKEGSRGAGADTKPATEKDIAAIARNVAQGKSITMFQQTGSVPTKLDRATPDLIARTIGAESKPQQGAAPGVVQVNSTSPTGVQGAMQVTKPTFKEMELRPFEQGGKVESMMPGQVSDRRDPHQSILQGTKYLNTMLKQFGGNVDLALAAYNSGPGTVEKILSDNNFPKNNTTIDMLTPHFPKTHIVNGVEEPTQDTTAYVKKITSRGRVTQPKPPAPQQGNGFFSAVGQVASAVNPFSVSEAQAEEPVTAKPEGAYWTDNPESAPGEPTDLGTLHQGTPPPASDVEGEGGAEGGTMPPPLAGGAEAVTSDPLVTPSAPSVPNASDAEAVTTDPLVTVTPMETAPRGDVPPVSEINAALSSLSKDGDEDVSIAKSAMPNAGRATKFIRNSPVGKFLGEIAREGWFSDAFKAGENFANALTFGLYDEGMSAMEQSMGFDSGIMQKEIRSSLADFRKEQPRTAFISDVLGSVAGGAGAGLMLRALGVGAAAGRTLAPAGVKTIAKIGAAEGAARGIGEGTNTGERIMGAAVGGTVGAVFGAAGGAASKTAVGAPLVAGAAIGGLAGGVLGGEPSDVLKGAGIGATAGGISKAVVSYAPVVQRAITRAVTQLNDYKGLQTFGNMIHKVLTGKTPAEAVANLNGSETLVLAETMHVPRGQLKSILKELKHSKNPQIPQRLFDQLGDADVTTLVKAMGQLKGNKAVSAQLNKELSERAANTANRLGDEIIEESGIEPAARRAVKLLNDVKKEARDEAITIGQPIYDKAKATTPVFDSPKIKELLSTDSMKAAIAEARASVEKTMPRTSSKKGSEHIELADVMFERALAGLPIDDAAMAATKVTDLADNSFDILTEARRRLGKIAQTTGGKEGLDLKNQHKELTKEMYALNKDFEPANMAYSAALAKADPITKNSQLDAIADLADGNVLKALPDIMRMTSTDVQTLVDVIDDKKAMSDVALAFIKQRMGKQSNVKAKNLIKPGEWKNIEILVGKDKAAKLKETITAEAKIAASNARATGGSDTVPKLQAEQKLGEVSGASEPLEFLADIAAGSWKTMVANQAKKVFRSFGYEGDPAKIQELADILVLKAPKGIEAMEKILKVRGFTTAELRRMRPYLAEMQDTARTASVAPVTSMTGSAVANLNVAEEE